MYASRVPHLTPGRNESLPLLGTSKAAENCYPESRMGRPIRTGTLIVAANVVPCRLVGTTKCLFEPTSTIRAGSESGRPVLEFFVTNIRTRNSRWTYYKAARRFSEWGEGRRLFDLAKIKPIHAAAYIEELQRTHSKPTVRQHHLAALRMLFDWLVVGHVPQAFRLELVTTDFEQRASRRTLRTAVSWKLHSDGRARVLAHDGSLRPA